MVKINFNKFYFFINSNDNNNHSNNHHHTNETWIHVTVCACVCANNKLNNLFFINWMFLASIKCIFFQCSMIIQIIIVYFILFVCFRLTRQWWQVKGLTGRTNLILEANYCKSIEKSFDFKLILVFTPKSLVSVTKIMLVLNFFY